MNHPYMFIFGVMFIGWLLPEILVVAGARVPVTMNLFSAIGCGLIAASLVLQFGVGYYVNTTSAVK